MITPLTKRQNLWATKLSNGSKPRQVVPRSKRGHARPLVSRPTFAGHTYIYIYIYIYIVCNIIEHNIYIYIYMYSRPSRPPSAQQAVAASPRRRRTLCYIYCYLRMCLIRCSCFRICVLINATLRRNLMYSAVVASIGAKCVKTFVLAMYSYGRVPNNTVSEKKHASGEEHVWEERLSEDHIRGRIAVSAAGLQGKGSHKNNAFSQTQLCAK